MRWWLNTDHKSFSVDNAAVSGMDFSDLDPSIWMVQWIDGKGEIERQTEEGDNENGLREMFVDILPYCGYFQDFLEKLPRLTLPQAKKVQIELIIEVYNAKRQAPYHYPVAAGDYWWDASDASSAVNPAGSIQVVINTLNTLIGKVNALAGEINSIVVTQTNANIAAKVNSEVVSGVNTNVVTKLNQLVEHINANIVTPTNAGLGANNQSWDEVNAYIVTYGNNLVAYINDTFRAQVASQCMTGSITIGEGQASVAVPGIAQSGIPASTVSFPAISKNTSFDSGLSDSFGAIAGVQGIAGINWSTMPTVGALPGGQFVPIGATAPVTLTSAEIAGIQNGIAARANALNIKKNQKIGEVNALTTVPAVIAYDVTTGW